MGFAELIIAFLFLMIGFALAFFMGKSRESRLEERNQILENSLDEKETKLNAESQRANHAEKEMATLSADYRNLKERLTEQKQELEHLQENFRNEFKNLANDILEEKSKKFTEQNKEKLDALLKPLGEKISEFQKRVEDNHKEDIRGRSALDQHLKTLQELNQKMSDEAKNLTKALKGDTKQQGNWGEVILQRILEKSGLRKDEEYFVEQSVNMEDGRRHRPDVVVRLPDEKYLIIDSKVSLKDYENFSSSDDDQEREKALKQHISSIKNHVKGLSGRNYQHIHEDKSPDFVLLFIPIEPAFGLALQHDSNLYYEAFDRNIVIVSPSTLLATLATIDSIWKQEYQNKNAMEIAKRGGLLYDKFVGFVESLEDIGKRIEQTQASYDQAMTRLKSGSGNLLGQAKKLEELGASTSKKLSPSLMGIDEDFIEEKDQRE